MFKIYSGPLSHRRPGIAHTLLAVAALVLPVGSFASSSNGRTVTRVPDAVCFVTTITEQGHTRQSRMIRSSGNGQADRAARRVLLVTKRIDDTGGERQVHALVNWYGVGFTIGFFELDEPLPRICTTPPPERRGKR